jgi:hypothetical protein
MGMDDYEGDQEKPLTLHKYVAFENDPQDKTDPTGHGSGDQWSIRWFQGQFITNLISGYEDFPAQFPPGPYDPHLNASLAKNLWKGDGISSVINNFEKYFPYGGIFDYAGKYGDTPAMHQLGNVNFGLMMAAADFSKENTRRIAGYKRQRSNDPSKAHADQGAGLFPIIAPYGNIPAADEDVVAGWYWYENHQQ